jgi:hypothetical protein
MFGFIWRQWYFHEGFLIFSQIDPLDLIECDFVAAPVVGVGGARALVLGNLPDTLDRPVFQQLCCDAYRTAGVASRIKRATPDTVARRFIIFNTATRLMATVENRPILLFHEGTGPRFEE